MKQTKKAISLMLAVIVLLSMCPLSAFAESIMEMITTKGVQKITGEIFEHNPVKATPVADENFAGGTGAKDDPYLISNDTQLSYFRDKVNSGTSYEGLYLKLTADIALNDTTNWERWGTTPPANEWTAIGTPGTIFSGNFNGDGHAISGVYINKPKTNYQGLFGYVLSGTISNLGVEDSYVNGNDHVGGVVGYSRSKITSCYNTGAVTGRGTYGYVGGVVGRNEAATVISCYNTGAVTGSGNDGYVGGVVGYSNSGKISSCYNTSDVTGSGYHVGGVVGYSKSGTITSCYNTGDIAGFSDYVGGVVGYSSGTVTLCNNTGYVTGFSNFVGGVAGYSSSTVTSCNNTGYVTGNNFVGGIVGQNDNTVTSCYNTGYVTGVSFVGGIVGRNGGTVTSCYNTGDVTGSNEDVGGIVGLNFRTITSCYNTGNVTGKKYIGGVLGSNSYNNSIVTSCYYLDTCIAAGNSYGTALTDEQMRDKTHFEGFDFHNFWGIEPTTGYAYPQLLSFMDKSYGEQSAVWDGSIADGFASGSGTKSDPYIVEIASQLAFLAMKVNSGTSYSGEYIKLTKDIALNNYDAKYWVLNAVEWTPIGTQSNPFSGTFDGDNHIINGIYAFLGEYGGVFGYNNGTVKNLEIHNLLGCSYVGVVGHNRYNGTVTSCYNTGAVTGASYVGGVVGYNYDGTVTSCYNTGAVTGANYVGGVVGYSNSGTITSCYNTGAVTGHSYLGGVVGYNEGTITSCYNTGNVTGKSEVGGVAGYDSDALIISCYNTGYITGEKNIGGVLGNSYNNSTVTSCYYLDTCITGGNSYGTVLTDEQMRDEANFEGFDFHNFWGIEPTTGYVYPQLLSFMDKSYGEQSAVWDGSIADDFAGGSGTESDPYIIETASQLVYLAVAVNSGTSYSKEYIKLTNDITLNNYDAKYWVLNAVEWTPIGTGSNPFRGKFDGDNHTISGIYAFHGAYSGIFGYSNGTVKNLGINNLLGCRYVGVVGYNSGTITSCYNTGAVTGVSYVGGVVGYSNSGTITSCYNAGAVTGISNYVGGITGYGSGTITSCYNTGDVTGSNAVGGVVGYNSSKITSCYNTGDVTGANYVGGVSGYNYSGTVTTCYNTGAVNSANYVGGVVGYNSNTVTSCYNTGNVTSANYVGGVIGYNSNTVTSCYNTGNVTGKSGIGGVVGSNYSGTVTTCYSTGTIVGASNYVGGVVGYNSNGTVTSCYYLYTGITSGNSYGNALLDEQMRYMSNFVGFKFNTEWIMEGNPGYPYPELNANYHLYYKVTFVDGMTGETISTTMVKYGEDATFPTPPAHEGYTFTKWDSDGKNITGNTTIAAQYKEGSYHVVTFIDGVTNNVILMIYVNHGEDVTLPTPPEHEGYNFIGWDNHGKNITADTTITAQYAIKIYTVTFVDGRTGETISTSTVEHGSDVTLPNPPEHEGYNFIGWDKDGKNITADITITALYEIKNYTVTLVDGLTNETISTKIVEHGADATLPTPPEHEGYNFTGWDKNGKNITADITITAQYVIKTYTVTFVDWDGTVLDTQTVNHGAVATAPAAPTRVGYTFKGWDKTFANITADLTVTATYEINVYTVTFVDGHTGETISTATVEHGSDATLPTPPEHEGYNFICWDNEGKNITADTTITAQYAIKTYTVTFVDGHTGETISTTTVEHGSDVTLPTPPEHEGYNFTGWDLDGKNITADTTITAQYAIKTYTVTFVDWDGTVLDAQTINHGANATAPADPTRVGYTFTGWDNDGKSIKADTTISAQYAINVYTVTFIDGHTGESISTATIEHGKDVTLPTPPEHEGYNFTGWDNDGKNITADTIITAQYAIKTYTVTFKDWDGKTIDTQTVNHGADAIAPADPTRVGYTFKGWDKMFASITADLTVTATYEINAYTVTFKDGHTGDTISTITVEHGSDVTLPTPPEHEGYNFTGWDNDGKNITADTTITALYEQDILMGDVNGDGKVNTGDAVLILQYSVGLKDLTDTQKIAADYNHDSKINTGDAVAVLKFVVGINSINNNKACIIGKNY